MPRTDVHRESTLNPEDYEVVRYIYTKVPQIWTASDIPFVEEFRAEMRVVQKLLAERGAKIHGGWSSCDHCGAHFHHGVLVEHKPTKELLTIGWQCAENRFFLAKQEYDKKRVQKVLKMLKARRKRFTKLREFVAANPQVRLLKTDRNNHFFQSLRAQLINRCELSARQLEAISESIERNRQRQEERKLIEEQLPEPAPVVEGRIEVKGLVLGVKGQETYYGYQLKMLVVDDRGFKVWGTVPATIEGLPEGSPKGRRICFRGTVKRSPKDANFGFFSRPTNAEVL